MTLRTWIVRGLAAFLDGFIDGIPVGSPAGGVMAFLDGQTHADLDLRHLTIEAAHLLAVPCFTGLSDFRAFHKANRLSDVFGLPSNAPESPNQKPNP